MPSQQIVDYSTRSTKHDVDIQADALHGSPSKLTNLVSLFKPLAPQFESVVAIHCNSRAHDSARICSSSCHATPILVCNLGLFDQSGAPVTRTAILWVKPSNNRFFAFPTNTDSQLSAHDSGEAHCGGHSEFGQRHISMVLSSSEELEFLSVFLHPPAPEFECSAFSSPTIFLVLAGPYSNPMSVLLVRLPNSVTNSCF